MNKSSSSFDLKKRNSKEQKFKSFFFNVHFSTVNTFNDLNCFHRDHIKKGQIQAS